MLKSSCLFTSFHQWSLWFFLNVFHQLCDWFLLRSLAAGFFPIIYDIPFQENVKECIINEAVKACTAGGEERVWIQGNCWSCITKTPNLWEDTMAFRRRNNRRSSSKPKQQRLYKVVCAGCAKELKLEVAPPIGKALFCLDCYKK